MFFDGHLEFAEVGNFGFRGFFDWSLFSVVFLWHLGDVSWVHDLHAEGGNSLAGVGPVIDKQVDRALGIELGLDDVRLEGRGFNA